MKWYQAKGAKAARLRQRKHELVRQFRIPETPLPGSLALSYRRCGKARCHCADGEGHSQWTLTFMVDGKKRVEAIPAEWVKKMQPLVDTGRRYKKAVAEVFAINAQLLALWKKTSRKKR